MKITVNFDAGDFERNLKRQVLQAADRKLGDLARRAGAKRCPIHNKAATVARTSDGYSIKACCEAFRAEIQRELGGR
jgi:hypothetical protein